MNSVVAGGMSSFRMELGTLVFLVYLVVPAIFAEDVSCKFLNFADLTYPFGLETEGPGRIFKIMEKRQYVVQDVPKY